MIIALIVMVGDDRDACCSSDVHFPQSSNGVRAGGAVIKANAGSPDLLTHTGPACVFKVTRNTIHCVLRESGLHLPQVSAMIVHDIIMNIMRDRTTMTSPRASTTRTST